MISMPFLARCAGVFLAALTLTACQTTSIPDCADVRIASADEPVPDTIRQINPNAQLVTGPGALAFVNNGGRCQGDDSHLQR